MAFAAWRFHLILAAVCCVYVFAQNDPLVPRFPLGDPRNCPLEKGVYSFEVLPGGGWDNLNNQDMGFVFEKNYSKCKLSDDGKFLLPDNVFLYPVKNSIVEVSLGISGSYSSELQSVKEHQINDKSVITRVQIRHNLYKAKIQPDSALDSALKSRLLFIASHLQHNNKHYSEYLAQLLIRDFGTHYISTVNAGAILAKLDHLKQKYVEDFKGEKSNITRAASASFFASFLGFDGKLGQSDLTEKEDIDQFRSNTVFSSVFSIGGPPFRVNFSVNQWEEQLPDELVAIDRMGDPLHFVITSGSLPELSERMVNKLRSTVKKAIKQYYDRNTIKGCMKLDSPNFSFQANVGDDSSCIMNSSVTSNLTFGGIYQTCECKDCDSYVNTPNKETVCKPLSQTNYLTGDFSCPPGFDAVLVFEGRIPWPYSWTDPVSCATTWRDYYFMYVQYCSRNGEIQVNFLTHYSTYWCAASGAVPSNKGYLFGGIYGNSLLNPVTQSHSCPAKFYPLTFGATMHVCVSDDYELGYKGSVPFGGFFSCQHGNPFAAGQSELGEFIKKPGPPESPRSCPAGYSQHLGAIEDDCEIRFCVKSNVFNREGFPVLKRPPHFEDAPEIRNYSIPLMLINQDSAQVWFKPSYSPQWLLATESSVAEYQAQRKPPNAKEGGLAKGTVAGIVVAVLVIVIVAVSATVWHRYKGFTLCRKNGYQAIVGSEESRV
ncbi:hypothetical protein ACROYT_G042554 [Oculina patagonica]